MDITLPLVAVSYPVDDEFERINREVLGSDARITFLQQLPRERWPAVLAEADVLVAWNLPREVPAELASGIFDQNTPSLTLDGSACGILGFGGIGRATAGLMRPFGARIFAINTSGHTDEPVEFVGTLADLDAIPGQLDAVIISLPLTRATRGLIDKPGIFYRAARQAALGVRRFLHGDPVSGVVRPEDYE